MDFHSKIIISNYSDIRSVYHSNYSNTKFHIHFSSTQESRDWQNTLRLAKTKSKS